MVKKHNRILFAGDVSLEEAAMLLNAIDPALLQLDIQDMILHDLSLIFSAPDDAKVLAPRMLDMLEARAKLKRKS